MAIVLLGVLAYCGNILIDKFILAKQKVSINQFIPLLFSFLFIVTALTLPWTAEINTILAANQQYIFYLILMVLLAIIWNIFYYQGLQKEKMIEFEMILLLTPLATILLATLFFPEEFNPPIFGAAIIASLALLLSHVRQHHLEFDRYAIHLLLAVLLMAMEVMVQKELLNIYSPALLYAVRTGILAVFFHIYYQPKVDAISHANFNRVFLSGVLGALAMVALFTGYKELGVTYTTLLFLLVPIMVSWIDAKMNHTPIRHRTVIGFVIIFLCVVYATIVQ